MSLFSPNPNRKQVFWWFLASLAIALLYMLLVMQPSFGRDYLVQDDARQHVFWMQQFRDPGLFRNDWIADYFRSIVPWGYTTFYGITAGLGIDPLVLSRFIPLGLGLVTTGFCFGICYQIFPVPIAAFLSTFLLTQNLWIKDDLASGTPRAFFYPMFTAFLYFLLQRSQKPVLWKSLLPCCVTLLLQGLFYPQTLLLSCGVLVLNFVEWQKGRIRLPQTRGEWGFVAAGLITAFLVLLPFALQTSEYGPILTAAEARPMPEFADQGRVRYFVPPLEYWLSWQRSGIFPTLWVPPLLLAGFLLPLLGRFHDRIPLLHQIRPQVKLLVDVILASLGWFFLAHALLFRLQLPSRYTQHSFRIICAVAAAIALTLLLDALWQWYQALPAVTARQTRPLLLGSAALFGAILLYFTPTPATSYPYLVYVTGRAPTLYQFLQQQPKDSLIASLTLETNNLPTFAQRSILTSREYALPYHKAYYQEIRQRTLDLIQAQYNPNLPDLQAFIRQYGIDFFVIEQESFKVRYLKDNPWIMQFEPAASEAIATLEARQRPALARTRKACSVFVSDRLPVRPPEITNPLEAGNLEVLSAECILKRGSRE
jgi:hypothetical protein